MKHGYPRRMGGGWRSLGLLTAFIATMGLSAAPAFALSPVITSISPPPSGPTTGGTTVEISGSNLSTATSVYFGNVSVPVTVINSTYVLATSPQSLTTGSVPVSVYAGTVGSNNLWFNYLSPSSGPFVGVYLSPSSQVVAPGNSVSVQVMADPPVAAENIGSWNVQIQYNKHDLTASCGTLNLSSGCSVNPSTGVITITGQDSAGITGIADLQGLTFTAQSNPSNFGTTTTLGLSISNLTDSGGAQIYSRTAMGATVYETGTPTITNVTPDAAWPGGGVPVTVTGTNFAPNAQVTLGGIPLSNVVVNSSGTQITADTPYYGVLGDVFPGPPFAQPPTAVNGLCILRAVAGEPSSGGCPSTTGMEETVPLTVTNSVIGSAAQIASTSFTIQEFNVSGSDQGTPTATDALCALRISAGLPSTLGCPQPTP